jgi:thiamine-phosphate pyrophosphorylase
VSVLRLIDANLNRASEAARVLEDAGRFLADDAVAAAGYKRLRHDLRSAARPWQAALVHARDTAGDLGTGDTAAAEAARAEPADVIDAAAGRLAEALRALEEWSKLEPEGGPASAAFKRLRYTGYELHRRLRGALGGGVRPPRAWRLCVLLTHAMCEAGGGWRRVLDGTVAGGADCVQVREKPAAGGLDGAALLQRVRGVIDICRPAGVAVVVNDRVDVALAAGADGVHLGQHDLPVDRARRVAADRPLWIGVSTSRLEQVDAAERAGADYIGVGPMFATSTAPEKATLAGPGYVQQVARHTALPHLAIGGITPGNVKEVLEAGARGIAVSSAVCGADDPQAATCKLRSMIDAAVAGEAGRG